MLFKHAPAANQISVHWPARSIEASAYLIQLLEYLDISTGNLSVTDKEHRSRQRRDAASDKIVHSAFGCFLQRSRRSSDKTSLRVTGLYGESIDPRQTAAAERMLRIA